MSELHIESPALAQDFTRMLAEQDIVLPLRPSETEVGSVVDAQGREVFVVDVNGERPDDQVALIAALLIVAINTCGGFQLEVGPNG